MSIEDYQYGGGFVGSLLWVGDLRLMSNEDYQYGQTVLVACCVEDLGLMRSDTRD